MDMTSREFWTVAHGLILGSLYLLAFAGGLSDLWGLSTADATAHGIHRRIRRLTVGAWLMAGVAWLTVVIGTYLVYPWYRAPIPTSPRSLLLADPHKAEWHKFGMEWKEHVAWLTPILVTAVAYVITKHGDDLANRPELRRAVTAAFVLAFLAAAVAGLFGAFINKVAPIL